ncbi:hypothetical protein RJ639_045901 [Escallonia herrerae]|uniref:Uncharacterized protein n=1 Tax=Escallonia herrerae TaxID=1293975 RepID=A0AA88W7Q4_9ASTE|nr:hypothetical protein RJ639_045901 [Escallonia herrerae]
MEEIEEIDGERGQKMAYRSKTVAQVVLDAVIRLCRVYFDGVKWDLYVAKTEEERNSCEENDIADHVITTTRCTVEKLCELGILAAKGGGNLVSVLNLSRKGVVTLLQLGKGALAVKLNVADIIFTLLSLANESLRFAAETWSYLLKEKVSVAEAKRISFQISLSKEELLKSASDALAELLEPTSFHLLNSLLNSAQVKHEEKFQILDGLFSDGIRHAEIDLVIDIIDKLCSLLRSVASSESVFVPGSGLRKIARSTCMLLSYCSQSTVDRVYNSMVGGNTSKSSLIMYFALLMEGFPLNLLPDKTKSAAKQRIVTEYFCFLESFEDKSSGVCGSSVFGTPLFAVSAALQSLELSRSFTDTKTLNLLIAIIRKYKDSVDCSMKDYYRKLLSETLRTISSMKHLYASDDMEAVILELQNLFILGLASSDTKLYQCKPNLACFMAGLGHIEFAVSDNSVESSAVWELYHMLLRECHWALVHLAITAFGYFAERTTCNDLWRFVPPDAALSFDLESGNEADEERFMSELKVFLEKEMASLGTTDLSDQAGLLVKEGQLLKEMIQKVSKMEPEAMICEAMETDDEQQANKRRKLPEGISKGVELLRSGLKALQHMAVVEMRESGVYRDNVYKTELKENLVHPHYEQHLHPLH